MTYWQLGEESPVGNDIHSRARFRSLGWFEGDRAGAEAALRQMVQGFLAQHPTISRGGPFSVFRIADGFAVETPALNSQTVLQLQHGSLRDISPQIDRTTFIIEELVQSSAGHGAGS